jgi:hypothetical protein
MAAFGDAHSTPRAPRRSQTALAADKSFSEPPAGHAQPELEVHPASDNIPSHLSIDQVPRILPVHLQQPTEGRRPTADWAGPRMPAPDAPAPRNVRVLSQPEFIDTEPHYELTAGSAMTANGAAPVAKRPSGAPPQHEPAAIHAAPRGQSAREVASGVGRAAAGSAGPTRRGKAVPSPRSAGLATEAKRYRTSPRSAADGRASCLTWSITLYATCSIASAHAESVFRPVDRPSPGKGTQEGTPSMPTGCSSDRRLTPVTTVPASRP